MAPETQCEKSELDTPSAGTTMVGMRWLYRRLIRPCLFLQDSETIHNRTLATLGALSQHAGLCRAMRGILGTDPLPIDCFGLRFPNPVGIAAGMDKLGEAVPAWEAMGFGFSELGGVTAHGQPGNPKPRAFRIIPDEAIINRMGFNNPGAAATAERLAAWRRRGRWPAHPVGMNLGKTKVTPLEQSPADYAASLKQLWEHCDFFVVNVSSPNTPNLRQLQDKSALSDILAALQEVNDAAARTSSTCPRTKPILVKIAPDLTFAALDDVLELVESRRIAGMVATNTTVARPDHPREDLKALYAETGGLSGRPLRKRSTEVIRHLYLQTRGRLPIIGVGGVFSGADAWEKITQGASLIQVYTGLVYEGPGLARSIVRDLRTALTRAGLKSLSQAVGSAVDTR